MSLEFQITDILSDDLKICNKLRFVITIYGIDEHHEKVVCHVRDFRPYFFVRIPADWEEPYAKGFLKHAMNLTSKKKLEESVDYTSVLKRYKELYGFHWNQSAKCLTNYRFAKVSFHAFKYMKQAIRSIKEYYGILSQLTPDDARYTELKYDKYEAWFDRDTMHVTSKCDSNLYETNIHPVVRFIHERKIKPTGWIKITSTDTNEPCDNNTLFKAKEYACLSGKVGPSDTIQCSPYIVASFDIECDSSHGDFPQTTKKFKKLATDIFDGYRSDKVSRKFSIARILPSMIYTAFGMKDKIVKFIKKEIDKVTIHDVYTIEQQKPTVKSINSFCKKVTLDAELSELRDAMEKKQPIKGKQRDTHIKTLYNLLGSILIDDNGDNIKEQGDPVIQIGTVFHTYGIGDRERVILVKGPDDDTPENEICDSLDEYDISVRKCKSEADMLIQWSKLLREKQPDFITGYNIFGFDFTYLYERARVCFPCKPGCNSRYNTHAANCKMRQFLNMGVMDCIDRESNRHYGKQCKYIAKDLNSSALGENALGYFQMDGRILFDIQKEVQKNHSLESYKLDNVAAHFMRGKIKDISHEHIVTELKTLKIGDYVSFRTHCNIGEQLHKNGLKYEIKDINRDTNTIVLSDKLHINKERYHKVEWCLNKDDITPQDIFDKHQDNSAEGSKGRAEVAKYCIQDCELCIDLLLLLDLIPTNLAMADVSYVPVSYIFLRGQGVRVTSLVARQCDLLGVRMPDLRRMPLMRDYVRLLKNKESIESVRETIIKDNSKFGKPKEWEVDEWMEEAVAISTGEKGMEGYEGAIVLDPKPDIYLDDPVAVLDYASLYPSSIIEKNCSHETQIDASQLHQFDEKDYHTVVYDNYEYILKGKGNSVDKVLNTKQPKKTCYFIKPQFLKENGEDSTQGIIPMALQHLLKARKETKEKMKEDTDEFKYKVLDCEQLALKVTANSIYGQLGARTSPICKMDLAASTTAIGREKIDIAKQGVMKWAEKKGYEPPDVVYGDTDSVFVKFSRVKDGKTLEGKEALAHCIECGKQAGEYITRGTLIDDSTGETKKNPKDALLDDPQDLEYEKTFWPFILISKKRYTGDKYEFSADEIPKRTAMGIVLKRRDNAPIVKHIFGNVIEIIMIQKNFEKALQWMKTELLEIGKKDISKFVITKSLRGYYKNPEQIAHKVLADRMTERDPGNKPKANDRIPYAYIELPDEVLYDMDNPYKSGPRKGKPRERAVKQGDRIEHVDYIKEHNKRLDYAFYITNQIMNPVKQVLDLKMDPKKTEEIFTNILEELKSNTDV